MSELPRTDDPPLDAEGVDAERVEEAFATFAERVHELELVTSELRAELRALRAERTAPPAFDDAEVWPADGASPGPAADWVAAVPPPLSLPSSAPRLVAEGAFLVVVALLAGLADLSAAWIGLIMLTAWALVALSEWAAAAKRARWHLEEVAPAREAPAADDLGSTGPWDVPVVQATAIETPDDSESRTVVAQLPAQPPAQVPAQLPAQPDTPADTEETMAPSAGTGRRLRFWRRPPVETSPDPWEA